MGRRNRVIGSRDESNHKVAEVRPNRFGSHADEEALVPNSEILPPLPSPPPLPLRSTTKSRMVRNDFAYTPTQYKVERGS
jgi:hypothetical protein